MSKLYLHAYFLIQLSVISATEPVINTVDHKNLNLSYYLDRIKYNTEEKLGILPYILAKPNGVFLEIGTGGDPIAMLLAKLPANISPTIIASDVDANILQLLPTRHPNLNRYLMPNATGPRLQLKQLDATAMNYFTDSSLDGINASAVVHEIVSYAGGLDGFSKFILEATRILKPDGVLIYRDPEAVAHKNELVVAHFKTPAMRLFTHVFIVKFLDNVAGTLASTGRKYNHYDPQEIKFTVYKKNSSAPCQLSYHEYLQLRSYEIDFNRPYTLQLTRGLCREIERHYLTYLHDCNPLIFVKLTPIMGSELYSVNYLAHSTPNILQQFLLQNQKGLTETNLADAQIDKLIRTQISQNLQVLEYGILLRLSSKRVQKQLQKLLNEQKLDPNLYMVCVKNHEYLLDYRIFALLYDQISLFFDAENRPVNDDDTVHAHWLKREGEETYIYYSDDELITRVAELSLNQNSDQTSKLILCPISPTHNKFIPRLCYNEILRESLEIYSMTGHRIKIKEGKRVIHFNKMTLEQALPIYQAIINHKPERYPRLQKLIYQLNTENQKQKSVQA